MHRVLRGSFYGSIFRQDVESDILIYMMHISKKICWLVVSLVLFGSGCTHSKSTSVFGIDATSSKMMETKSDEINFDDQNTRMSFLSPDGVWNLHVDIAGSPDKFITHSIVIRRTNGKGKKILASVDDILDTQAVKLSVHNWLATGWSADSKMVFFTNTIVRTGNSASGTEMYSVNIADGKMKKIR